MSVSALLLIAVAVLAATQVNEMQRKFEAAATLADQKVDIAHRWSTIAAENVVRVEAMAISSDPVVEATYKGPLADAISSITELQKQLAAASTSDVEKEMLAAVAANRTELQAAMKEAQQLKASDMAASLVIMRGRFAAAALAYSTSIQTFVSQQTKQKTAVLQDFQHEHQRTMTLAGAALGVFLVTLLLGSAWLVRSIKRPLSDAMELADRISRGDLSERSTQDRQDEFGALLSSMRAMSASLRTIVTEVRSGVDSVMTASSQIAAGISISALARSRQPPAFKRRPARWTLSSRPSTCRPRVRRRLLAWPRTRPRARPTAACSWIVWSPPWRR